MPCSGGIWCKFENAFCLEFNLKLFHFQGKKFGSLLE